MILHGLRISSHSRQLTSGQETESSAHLDNWKRTTPRDFEVRVRSAQPFWRFTVVLGNNMATCFLHTLFTLKKACVCVGGCWLAKLICLSEGGESSLAQPLLFDFDHFCFVVVLPKVTDLVTVENHTETPSALLRSDKLSQNSSKKSNVRSGPTTKKKSQVNFQ